MDPKIDGFLAQQFGSKSYEVFALAGDASARKYYRVVFEDQTYVLMSWEPFVAADYPFLSVQKLFAEVFVRVPKVVRVAEKLGLILLEDLGDLTLERKFWENQNTEAVLPYYEQSIEELFKIHFQTLNAKSVSTAHSLQFDKAKFLWEFNYTREHLFEKLNGGFGNNNSDKVFLKFSDVVSEKLDQEPKWICHRDYHSRNLMIKLNKIYVIDFQDARGGPIHYDLVSLLRDSYVNLSDDLVDRLTEGFWNQAKNQLKGDNSWEHFLKMFELQSLQRGLKACGSFASFWNQREDLRYLKYLPPTLNRVHSILKKWPEFREFKEWFEATGILEKEFVK